MRTTPTLDRARRLGRAAALAYRDQCGEAPTRGVVGDWDSLAWSESWRDLVADGATSDDYGPCLDAWRAGFFGERPRAGD